MLHRQHDAVAITVLRVPSERPTAAAPVHGSAKQRVVAVCSPSSGSYRRACLAGMPSFFSSIVYRARRLRYRARQHCVVASRRRDGWCVFDVAIRRRDEWTMRASARRGLADFLVAGPLEQPVADVPELQVELVVDVLGVLHLLDDGG